MDNEIKSVIENLNTAFEAFKKSNDERLVEIEKKGKADPLLEEAVQKASEAVTELSELKKQLEKVEAKVNRPGFENQEQKQSEHKQAFTRYLKTGDDSELKSFEKKDNSVGVNADGGFAVPDELDRDVLARLRDVSPMRQLCDVFSAGKGYQKLVDLAGTTSGWVGETAARSTTNTPTLAMLTPFWGEIYASPRSTQQALDDVFFNIESWLAESVAVEFAEKEGAAFVSGDGTNKPKGFLAYTTAATADSSRAFGTIEHIATGVAGDFAASNKGDVFFDVVGKIKKGYRPNARWMMNKALLTEIRKFKDSQGNYLLRSGLEFNVPDSLLGYAIEENEDMPAKAASSLSIAFADFKQAYAITDMFGVRTLRDPYTAKPYVVFYSTKRVGGFLKEDAAIKLVKFAVS